MNFNLLIGLQLEVEALREQGYFEEAAVLQAKVDALHDELEASIVKCQDVVIEQTEHPFILSLPLN